MSASHQIYYHGTTVEAAERILNEGFRVWFHYPEDACYLPVGGNLGLGVYVSDDWRVALWFGNVLLEVETTPGTRILDVSAPEDKKVLASLRRKFGNEILRKPHWKVLPANKSLSGSELVSLVRYHYHGCWDRLKYSMGSTSYENHDVQLQHLTKLLRRHGYHGFGHPQDEMGFVLFDPTRLKVKCVVAHIPVEIWEGYFKLECKDSLWDSYFKGLPSFEELTRRFPPGPQFSRM